MLLLKGFIEVSEGEEESEMSDEEEVVKSSKEESQVQDLSDRSPSLNSSKVEEQEAESSGDASTVPAPSEWDNIDMVDLFLSHHTISCVQMNHCTMTQMSV